jgi:peptidoglycan/xylan/chitin deacetylase (PgdA/CDA1 family)
MSGIARRRLLAAAPALAAAAAFTTTLATAAIPTAARGDDTPPPVRKVRSLAATRGAAPFETAHLIPGDALDLATVNRASPAARVVALTFDDGPDGNDTAILARLAAADARATFFFIGHKVAGRHAIVQRVVAAGHEVGNHTFEHPMMSDLPATAQRRTIVAASDALTRAGASPLWFRPPFGDFDADVVARVRAAGLRTALWTVDSRDWKEGTGAGAIASRVTGRLAPGAVVLLHSTRPATLEALPAILAEGRRQGLTFVTMSDWAVAMASAT